MRLRARFFAGTRDAVGASALDVELPDGSSVQDMFEHLAVQHPDLARYRDHALIAVGGEFAGPEHALADGDEVAFMPPVSGGADADAAARVVLDAAPFSLDAMVALVRGDGGAGAVVTFEGIVRATSGEQADARVQRLHFEAFPELARRELARVRDDAIAKFHLTDCALHHRVGTLELGEPIVAVVVAAPHRVAAFEAAAWIMDELKTRVPVWKREEDDDGTSRWVNDAAGGRPPRRAADTAPTTETDA